MNKADPLVENVAGGLTGCGPAERAYLGYLAIQALVVLVWWPTGELYEALFREQGPDTLLAALIACGAATAYHGVRAGAEEFLLSGQTPLRQRPHATPLSSLAILRECIVGHVLQVVHAIALSSPLLLAAFEVGGGTWSALGWALGTVLLQATFYRLCATAISLAIGHRRELIFWTVRATFVAGYVTTAAWFPAASHPVICTRLVGGEAPIEDGVVLADLMVFLLAYALLSVALSAILYWRLQRERRTVRTLRPRV